MTIVGTQAPAARTQASKGGVTGAPLVAPLAASAWSRADTLLLLGLVVLAAIPRLYGLSGGLWYDEIQTLVNYVREPLGRILVTYDSQNQHMLYSVAARIASVFVADESVAVRLPAALFGIASIGALFLLARRIADRREAALAALLLAASYHHVWFSQNARGYTGLLLWTILSTWFFLECLSRPRWSTAIAYALTMALAAYTQMTGALTAVAHALVWLGLAVRERRRAGDPSVWLPGAAIALSGLFTLLLYAPILTQVIQVLGEGAQAAAPNTAEWKSPLWLAAETVRGLARGLPGGYVAVAGALVVGGAGLLSYARTRPVFLLLALVPPLLTAAVMLLTAHNLWPRFFFAAAGFAMMIGVRGVFALARAAPLRSAPALATAALVLAAAGSALTLRTVWNPKQDFEGAAAYLGSEPAPGDAVVGLDMAHTALAAYPGFETTRITSVEELAAIEARHPRTWVVYTFEGRMREIHGAIMERLEEEYREAAEFDATIGDGDIRVRVRP